MKLNILSIKDEISRTFGKLITVPSIIRTLIDTKDILTNEKNTKPENEHPPIIKYAGDHNIYFLGKIEDNSGIINQSINTHRTIINIKKLLESTPEEIKEIAEEIEGIEGIEGIE